MANPDGSMDGWAALQHQGPEEPLSSGLSPAAADRQTDVMRNVAALKAVVPLPKTGGGTSLATREVLASSFDARR